MKLADNASDVLLVSDDVDWESLRQGLPKKEKEVIVTEDGRNPVMELNELFHGLAYNHEDPVGPGHSALFKTTVYIEGVTYEGEGNMKKESKNRCALNALNALKASGRYAERMSEVLNKRQQNLAKKTQFFEQVKNDPNFVPFWKMNKKKNDPGTKNAPLPQNAIGKLNDRFRGLKFDVIQSQQDQHTREWNFSVCLKFQGQIFVGNGVSKKAAKIACAEQCLNWLGLNSPESGAADVGEEGVDLSEVDTSADLPITAKPLLPPSASDSWNKAPGSGRGGRGGLRGRGRGVRPIRGRGAGAYWRGGRGGWRGGRGQYFDGPSQQYDSYHTSRGSEQFHGDDNGYGDSGYSSYGDTFGSDPKEYGGWTSGGTLNQYPPDSQYSRDNQQW